MFNIVTGIICIDMNEEEFDLCTSIQNRYLDERVIIITNLTSQEDAIEWIQIGNDYFELRYVASIYNIHGDGLYKAEVYS